MKRRKSFMNLRLEEIYLYLVLFLVFIIQILDCTHGQKILNIGTILPQTGPSAVASRGATEAVQYGCKELENYITGYQVVCSPTSTHAKDDQSLEVLGLFGALELTSDVDSVAVVGCFNSAVTIQANLVLSRRGVVQITGASTSPRFESKINYPGLVRSISSDSIQFKVIAHWIKSLGWLQVGVFNSNDAFGEGGATVFVDECEKIGVRVLTRQIIVADAARQGVDITPQVLALKNSGAKIIVTSVGFGDGSFLFQVATKLNMLGSPDYVFLGTWSDGAVAASAGDPATSTLLTGTLATANYVNTEGSEYKTFAAGFTAQHPTLTVTQYSAYKYDSIKLLIYALKPTIEAMASLGLDGRCLGYQYFTANKASCQYSTAYRDTLFNIANCNDTSSTSPCEKNNGVINVMTQLPESGTVWSINARNPVNIYLIELYKYEFTGVTGNVALNENGERQGLTTLLNGITTAGSDGKAVLSYKDVGIGNIFGTPVITQNSETMIWAGGTLTTPNTKKPNDGTPGPDICLISSLYANHLFKHFDDSWDEFGSGVGFVLIAGTVFVVEAVLVSVFVWNRVSQGKDINERYPKLIRRNSANFLHLFSILFQGFQVVALVMAVEQKWTDLIPLDRFFTKIGLDFSDTIWYFWLMFSIALLWVVYAVVIITGIYVYFEKFSFGRWFLMPIEIYLPAIAQIGYIPILSATLGSLSCNYAFNENIEPVAMMVLSCEIECWTSEHWLMAILGFFISMVYFPFVIMSAHFWQDMADDLDIIYDPRYFLIESLAKFAMVVMKIFFVEFESSYIPILIILNCFMVYVNHWHHPSHMPWVNNYQALFYSMGAYGGLITAIVLASSQEDAIWPFWVLIVGWALFIGVTIFFDIRNYPDKWAETERSHRLSTFKNLFKGETLKNAASALKSFGSTIIHDITPTPVDPVWKEKILPLCQEIMAAENYPEAEQKRIHKAIELHNECLYLFYMETLGNHAQKFEEEHHERLEHNNVSVFTEMELCQRENMFKSLLKSFNEVSVNSYIQPKWRQSLHPTTGHHIDMMKKASVLTEENEVGIVQEIDVDVENDADTMGSGKEEVAAKTIAAEGESKAEIEDEVEDLIAQLEGDALSGTEVAQGSETNGAAIQNEIDNNQQQQQSNEPTELPGEIKDTEDLIKEVEDSSD
eukprot:Nk52_evm20s343 gene=Nk52_evmTU20s343